MVVFGNAVLAAPSLVPTSYSPTTDVQVNQIVALLYQIAAACGTTPDAVALQLLAVENLLTTEGIRLGSALEVGDLLSSSLKQDRGSPANCSNDLRDYAPTPTPLPPTPTSTPAPSPALQQEEAKLVAGYRSQLLRDSLSDYGYGPGSTPTPAQDVQIEGVVEPMVKEAAQALDYTARQFLTACPMSDRQLAEGLSQLADARRNIDGFYDLSRINGDLADALSEHQEQGINCAAAIDYAAR